MSTSDIVNTVWDETVSPLISPGNTLFEMGILC